MLNARSTVVDFDSGHLPKACPPGEHPSYSQRSRIGYQYIISQLNRKSLDGAELSVTAEEDLESDASGDKNQGTKSDTSDSVDHKDENCRFTRRLILRRLISRTLPVSIKFNGDG